MVSPDLFNEVAIFSLLDSEERQVLAKQVSAREFKKGQIIFNAGNPGGYAYLIQKGEARVTIIDASGEEILVDIATEGGLIGMSSLLAGEKHLTTAVASENTSAIEIDRNDITTLIMTKPMAGLDMMTIVEKHLRSVHELMQTRASRNPNEEIEGQEPVGQKLADNVVKFDGRGHIITIIPAIVL